MNYLKQREEKMGSEVPEDSYRKRFPKGKDWKTPKKNPFGFCGLNESSYHGMETVAISIEKYNELKQELEDLKTEYYFNIRNKHMEYLDLKKDFNTVVTCINNLFQGDPKNEFIKKTLQRVGIIPKGDIY